MSDGPRVSVVIPTRLRPALVPRAVRSALAQTLTDIEVCYKMFTRAVCDELKITCNDFGCEIQISAQICRARKWRIYETGIHYFGRTYAEGKKINWKDGLKAFWYILKFRVAR